MKMDDIKTLSDLKDFVYKKEGGTICHYTSFESLIMILKNRSLRLSRYDMMNDLAEKRLSKCQNGDCRYLICFTGTTKESVAMWGLYGKHSSLKLRIEFSRKSLLESVYNSFFFDPVCKKHISPYQTMSVPHDITKRNFTLSDVIYYDQNKNKLRFNGRAIKEIDVTPMVISDFAGTIKYDAWEYEKEARLSVVLHNANSQNKFEGLTHIYTKLPNEFIRNLTITYSPWTTDEVFEQLKMIIDNLAGWPLKHKRSSLQGEVDEL